MLNYWPVDFFFFFFQNKVKKKNEPCGYSPERPMIHKIWYPQLLKIETIVNNPNTLFSMREKERLYEDDGRHVRFNGFFEDHNI
jgi:hypothetical protein